MEKVGEIEASCVPLVALSGSPEPLPLVRAIVGACITRTAI
jgi:hypothetical protein